MKKILIAIGDAGAGHISCANAVSDAIKEVNQDVDIQTIDLFSLSSLPSFVFLDNSISCCHAVHNNDRVNHK